MKYNDCKCKEAINGLMPMTENMMAGCNTPACNMPVRRHLQPILVARIYNQPIVEEIPFSSMSLTLDETATISSAYSEMKSMCGDYNCNDGYNYNF